MLCYRDRIFCPFKECKNFSTCDRALTDKIHNEAKKWWGDENPPIDQFMYPPDCYELSENGIKNLKTKIKRKRKLKTKIIEVKSVEEDFAFFGARYLTSKIERTDLAILGTAYADTGIVSLVARPEIANALMKTVNYLNKQWKEMHEV